MLSFDVINESNSGHSGWLFGGASAINVHINK